MAHANHLVHSPMWLSHTILEEKKAMIFSEEMKEADKKKL
jgi:hypothetical protein